MHTRHQQDPLTWLCSFCDDDGHIPELTAPHLDALKHEALGLSRLEVIDVELRDDRKALDLISSESSCGLGGERPQHDQQDRRQTNRGSAEARLGGCLDVHHLLPKWRPVGVAIDAPLQPLDARRVAVP
jgi:hypothetical protein